MRPILILVIFLSSQIQAQNGSNEPVSSCLDSSIAVDLASANTGDYQKGYTISVPANKYCFHTFIYAFYITYTLGTGDANSNFALTYY